LKTNVLVWKELLGLFKFAQAKYGQVDLVFANAGIPETLNAFEDVYDENGDLAEPPLAVVDVNLKSVALSESGDLRRCRSEFAHGAS
jgi:NAD(P)-dependent dehydrogenase (short-subunit alcohol dehydrogenase family)